jgi:hypothetical protein
VVDATERTSLGSGLWPKRVSCFNLRSQTLPSLTAFPSNPDATCGEQNRDSLVPSSEAGAFIPSKTRSRSRRRVLFCPHHPEERLLSVSQKHHLYLTDVGHLVVRGLSRKKADEILQAHRRVVALTDEWLECFWCESCQSSTWWHVRRHDRLSYSLSVVERELWEQASGVIRPEGNPSVSQFSRREARATGVQGLRQYRFL